MGEVKVHRNSDFRKSNPSNLWLGTVIGMNENMR